MPQGKETLLPPFKGFGQRYLQLALIGGIIKIDAADVPAAVKEGNNHH
ncbi:MAG: hypothetical protein PW788_08850 [Micavibrio sp.]|nr:hypothetical protein [Micavibrio sp.]